MTKARRAKIKKMRAKKERARQALMTNGNKWIVEVKHVWEPDRMRPTKRTGKQKVTKRWFPEAEFDRMTRYMADKIEAYGIQRVVLHFVDKDGKELRTSVERAGSVRRVTPALPIAFDLKSEDFGAFAQLC